MPKPLDFLPWRAGIILCHLLHAWWLSSIIFKAVRVESGGSFAGNLPPALPHLLQ